MAPRASWKGYLKLSLVSCPIALYPAASSSERISFNRINKKTGNRLKQQLVDAETGDMLEKEDIGRGYEIGKGQYLQIEDEEIEKIRIESSHTITIDTFVPRSEIDDRYIDDPYYIAPTDQVGQEAFAVIRDAIREKRMVALGRVVISRREHVMMLEAFDKGLLATTLRYPYEVRDQAAYFEDISDLKLPADMKELAAHIVDSEPSRLATSSRRRRRSPHPTASSISWMRYGRVLAPTQRRSPPQQARKPEPVPPQARRGRRDAEADVRTGRNVA
jgi:DNA end-binding protein Ku